jgi:hypothetical protein
MKRFSLVLPILLCAAVAGFGANLAVPAAQVGDGRVSFGGSYVALGTEITNAEVPLSVSSIGGHISYAPISYVNLGLDFGTARVKVNGFNPTDPSEGDTTFAFNGDFGWLIGAHLKLATPYFGEFVSILGGGNVNLFRSTNRAEAFYGGIDIAAALGVQFRIPDGAISIGPQLYLLLGENKGIDGTKATYTNVNNLRLWVAYDYIPDVMPFGGEHKPYVSLEITLAPKIDKSNDRPTLGGFSVSLSVGAIAADKRKSKSKHTLSYVELKELEQEIVDELSSEYETEKESR